MKLGSIPTSKTYVRRSRNKKHFIKRVEVEEAKRADYMDMAARDWVESIKPWKNGNRHSDIYSVIERKIWIESAAEVWWDNAALGAHLTYEDGLTEALSEKIRKKISRRKRRWKRKSNRSIIGGVC